MFKKFILMSVATLGFIVNANAQQYKSIVQEESEKYSAYNFQNDKQWDSLFLAENPGMTRKVLPKKKSVCTLNKVVYGWHPYWMGTTYNNYQWDLLSRLSYFSYEVDYSTGNAVTTNSWSTADAVDSALANGVKVDLCVTLMANHATFLASATAKQTLITNLISLVQSRGANGVNIDFESVPSAQATNYKNFIIDLCTQMHNSIPGSQVSIDLPSVEWTAGTYSVASLNSYVDMFLIMGYDYYYSGSATAGPTDPLYHFEASTYDYDISKSITYYLNQGATSSKLILGLPYYGRDWATAGSSVPSSTTATGTAKTFSVVMANASGYFSNKLWDQASYTPYYAYQISTVWHQCFSDDPYSFGKRLDIINQRGIGGMGMWALGNDDGYTDYWNKISEKLSSCETVLCSDTIYDMGGPSRNYYDNENYTYTIAPDGASSLTLTFSSFSAANDTLWIYNGASTTAPLIGAYTGTTSPGVVNASGNSLTLKFRSRASTNSTGWKAIWQCYVDNIAPTTLVSSSGNWKTQNFSATFTDTDNSGGSGIEKSFYQVLDYNGSEWHANAQNGFFADNFDSYNSSVWTVPASSGTWNVSGGNLNQTDSSASNTNAYATLNQNLSNRYVYQFYVKINTGTSGTSQHRLGFHFFSDNGSLTNRGNSYFIFFRQETSKLEFYKVVSDVFTQTKVVDNVTTTYGQLYDVKIIFDRISGKIDVYRDDVFLGSWTDPSPLTTQGNYISFRTGNCKASISELKVFRSRNASVTVSVGATASNDIRYQNPDPATYSARIKSIVNDVAGNLSAISYQNINVDWTIPVFPGTPSDGLATDIDTTANTTSISANWAAASDPNSGIDHYIYCFGTAPGTGNLIGWTSSGTDTFVTRSGFTLQSGQIYYVSVYAVNGAGLISDTITSDGIRILPLPVAGFSTIATSVCENDSVNFTNTSTNAALYEWQFEGGTPATSTQANPVVLYDTAGTFNVQLVSSGVGGTDTLFQNGYITVLPKAHAAFTANQTLVYLPAANVVFFNNSESSNSFLWNFGDDSVSTDQSPWHQYANAGIYTVTLIAYNNSCGNDTLVMTDYINVEEAVSVNEIKNETFSVFPNPAQYTLYITSSTTITRIQLFDSCGRLIYSSVPVANKEIIQLNNFSKGLYFVRIESDKSSSVTKFSKE
jgi:PKD repeat protein/spore germination protein YaaH